GAFARMCAAVQADALRLQGEAGVGAADGRRDVVTLEAQVGRVLLLVEGHHIGLTEREPGGVVAAGERTVGGARRAGRGLRVAPDTQAGTAGEGAAVDV